MMGPCTLCVWPLVYLGEYEEGMVWGVTLRTPNTTWPWAAEAAHACNYDDTKTIKTSFHATASYLYSF